VAIYLVASWGQVAVYRSLGESYSQDIVILKNHRLVQKGLYKYIRHPYYLLQILSDLGSSLALLSYLVFPLALIEIPILISRAKVEERLLQKHFPEQFKGFRNKTGFILPFIS
jgi:protein-S-isoprenylcysteine O-methyltransferase Ste14